MRFSSEIVSVEVTYEVFISSLFCLILFPKRDASLVELFMINRNRTRTRNAAQNDAMSLLN